MRRFLILAAGCTVLATAAWAQSPPTTPTPATPNPQHNAGPADHSSRMAQNDDEGDEGWRDRGWGRHGGGDHEGMGGRWDRHGGWRERHHDMMGEGSEMMRSGGRSAFFAFRSGRSGFMVRCPNGEPMKACVDATMTLLDKVQSMHRAESGTSPNAAPTPGATPAPNPGAGAR